MNDIYAVEELFAPASSAETAVVVDKDLVVNVWKLLLGEERRDHMARKIKVFSGTITEDEDHDGYNESRAVYKQGILEEYHFDADQDRIDDVAIIFNSGNPQWARMPALAAVIFWENYPSLQRAVLGN